MLPVFTKRVSLAAFSATADHCEVSTPRCKSRSSSNIPCICSASWSYPISVEDVADYTGVSRSYLFRLFQGMMNQSPKEYLLQYRIGQACQLLNQTDLTVGSIAHSVGFEDNLYFSKVFKKYKSCTPSEYRGMQS